VAIQGVKNDWFFVRTMDRLAGSDRPGTCRILLRPRPQQADNSTAQRSALSAQTASKRDRSEGCVPIASPLTHPLGAAILLPMSCVIHVYTSNVASCLAVLFPQERHGPDLILVALAGRVSNVELLSS
jgi:hypothetical protein